VVIAASNCARAAPLRARLLIKPMQLDPMISDRLSLDLRFVAMVPHVLLVYARTYTLVHKIRLSHA
jgi:hypothetical protein